MKKHVPLAPGAFILALVLMVLPLPALAQETSPLTIGTAAGSHDFKVEVADEPDELSQGLMFRESLDEDGGMLFDFGSPREANMWMKNTLISLDLLFVAPDGEILAITPGAVPGSLRRINPGFPVKGVVELKAGTVDRLGIGPGDTVIHPIFGNAGGE